MCRCIEALRGVWKLGRLASLPGNGDGLCAGLGGGGDAGSWVATTTEGACLILTMLLPCIFRA